MRTVLISAMMSILVNDGTMRYRKFETNMSEITAAMVVPAMVRPVPIAPMIFSSTLPLRFKTLMDSKISVSTE